MGFSKNYKLPDNMANSHLYKQAGNSVVVPVIERSDVSADAGKNQHSRRVEEFLFILIDIMLHNLL